jgi:CYTH domain-containing protein/predicted ATPase
MIEPIVLTGGPCSGKTTGAPYLMERLSDIGFYPVFNPEVPTSLMSRGITPKDGIIPVHIFQRLIARQILHEEAIAKLALAHINHPRPIIVVDRGLMDAKAYTEESEFAKILREHNLDLVSARDKRYSGVYHLRTAALGAEAFYGNTTNPHRLEDLTQARVQDERTLAAWIGHPHLRIIPNNGSFDQKLRRLFAEVCRQLGVPVPIEREHKFLIPATDVDVASLGSYQRIAIEQFYVWTRERGMEKRYRKRGQHGSYMYVETIKRPLTFDQRVETERIIDEREYELARGALCPGTDVICKDRICFVYQHQYFELDVFRGRRQGLVLLEIELTEEQDQIVLPLQFREAKDVTGVSRYSNRVLANL